MLKLFIILTFVTNLNYVLSDSSENDEAEAIASAIAVAQTSGTSSSSATSSATAYSSATVTSSNNCTSTETKCGKNQVYDLCPASCPPRTCATKDILFKCITPLKPGDPKCPPPKCRCADNFYSNDQGECVSKEQCPTKTCGINEEYVSCPVPSCAAQTCENIGKKFSCPAIPADYPCKGECRCKPGYYRNKVGQCISEAQCQQCGKNETFDLCPPTCPPMTCATKDIAFRCRASPKPGDDECPPPKCRCAPNYYRTDDGQCVLKGECPAETCGVNEVYLPCPDPPCPSQTCENIGLVFPCPAPPPNDPCKGECRCKDGYYRNEIGQCISESECKQCGKNQVYDLCPASCPPRTCATKDALFKCVEPLKPGDPKCPPPKCRCADNYYRNDQEECVPKEECPKCGKNQVYDLCPASCPPRTCATKDAAFKCIAPLKPGDPKCPPPKCRCADNFYSNDQGECVPKEECPSKTCGTNEIYVSCPKPTCSNQTCEEIGKIINCPLLPANYPCNGECQCKPGYYRNKVGRCISEADCKKCTRENEYFDCDNACDNICAKLSEYTHADCPMLNIVCNPMCYCVEGYARDANGKCIPISQCPPPKCGKNQVPTDCANSPCLRTCATKDLNIQCKPYPPGCKPGCKCADGYLKDDKGVCVPIDKCPLKKPRCGKNETFSDCPNQECRAQKCSELGFPLACDQLAQKNTDCGKPACICKPGFVRNEHNVCIEAEDCPSCGGDVNAVRGCGTFCTRCDNYQKKGQICPAVCELNGCECRPNYVYDSRTKKCVLPKDCSRCGDNEKFVSCSNAGCGKWNCTQVAQPALCIDVVEGGCIPGCVCETDFLRTAPGKCVPIDQCPLNEVCPDPNEYLDKCSTNCPDPECGIGVIPTFAPCTRPSNPADCVARCRCKDGYYRNADYKCIKKEECPPTCGPNEVPSDCGNNGCLPTCAQPDLDTRCRPNLNTCKPGCVCAEEFLRNDKGDCVPKDKCPSAPKCGLNEVPSDCGNNGCLPTCAEPERLTYCDYNPDACEPGCVCADGHLRNGEGVCVLKDNCPPAPQCGLNEVPSDCGNNGCLPTCAEPERLTYCSYNREICEPGCVCADGHLRNGEGVCVPKDECSSEQNVCLLPREQGRCRASIPRFYYDSYKKDCLKFIYGGCGGNGNNFNTKEECLKKCACNKK